MKQPLTLNTDLLAHLFGSVEPIAGKPILYQLTNEEGGTDEPGGRKVPAQIHRHYFDGRRDGQGRAVDRIVFVNAWGTVCVKDAPLDSSREPGTWDIYQPGDLRT
ncbi:MAG TPA: hypothetical protein VJ464_15895 [Blastocatellia bacterium]|nr:hypothetical protein [Blastocatellia bacterium]